MRAFSNRWPFAEVFDSLREVERAEIRLENKLCRHHRRPLETAVVVETGLEIVRNLLKDAADDLSLGHDAAGERREESAADKLRELAALLLASARDLD
jgi:hypothetical protein